MKGRIVGPLTMHRSVLMVVDKAPPDYGGAGAQALLLAQELTARGWHARILARRRGPASVDSRFVVFLGPRCGLGDGLLSNLLFSVQVFLRVLRSRAQVVHIHGAYYYGFAAALACKLRRRPYILKVTLLGRDDPQSLRRFVKFKLPVGRLLVKQFVWARRVIALNNAILESCLSLVDAECIAILPNGVDSKSLQRLRSDDAANAVVFSGAISRRKGVDQLLKAWFSLADDYPEWELRLIGPVRDDVAELVDEACSDPRAQVRHLGELSQEEAWMEMGSCSVFALPSRAEGLSNALLEAMTLGLRCVVSDIAVNEEVCGSLGFYAKSDQEDGLSSALRAAIEADVISNAAVMAAASYFSLDRLVDNYENMYLSLS
ncbi:glycosyltransferase family 4 protein [Rhodococcus sp. GXMU-t2271]|uniref:glycosyltransferase family 4 protein n=1 Tax=Rhodococcus sp. GXMU-t2271 TaxID=3059079 RepID=UPI00352A5E8F